MLSFSNPSKPQHPADSAHASRIPKDSFANLISSYGIGSNSFATSVPPSRAPSPYPRSSSSRSPSPSPSSSSRRASFFSRIRNRSRSANRNGSSRSRSQASSTNPSTANTSTTDLALALSAVPITEGLTGGSELMRVTSRLPPLSSASSRVRGSKSKNYEEGYSHLVSRHGLGVGAPCVPPVVKFGNASNSKRTQSGASTGALGEASSQSADVEAYAGAGAGNGSRDPTYSKKGFESGFAELEKTYGIGFGQGVVLGGFNMRM